MVGGIAERGGVCHRLPEVDRVVPAWVVSVGVLGVIRKHSLSLLSDDGGMPAGSEAEKSARQQ